MAKTYKNAYLFDYLRNILEEKSDTQYQKHLKDPNFASSYSTFMVANYLSMSANPDVRSIVIDNQLQLERMDQKLHYKFLLDNVPKQRSSFIRYLR